MNLKQLTALIQISGALIFIFLLIFLETTTPNYNWQTSVISDLGVNPTSAQTFNTMTIIAGIGLVIISILNYSILRNALFSLILAACGIAIAGIGLYPTNINSQLHVISAAVAFLLAVLAMLYSCRFATNLHQRAFALLGAISLIALLIFGLQYLTGQTNGVLENLIIIPFAIWNAVFGIFLSKN